MHRKSMVLGLNGVVRGKEISRSKMGKSRSTFRPSARLTLNTHPLKGKRKRFATRPGKSQEQRQKPAPPAEARHRNVQQPASPLLTRAKVLAQPAHFLPQTHEPQPFFE